MTLDPNSHPVPDPEPATIAVTIDGPLVLRGNIHMHRDDGRVATVARVALCRCGASNRKPMCDGSHRTAGFCDAGAVASPARKNDDPVADLSTLHVRGKADGPLWIEGSMRIVDGGGTVCWDGSVAALCRCGASARKPFCDGAHKANGFRSGA